MSASLLDLLCAVLAGFWQEEDDEDDTGGGGSISLFEGSAEGLDVLE
jgi:hypothetical protein